MKKRSDCRTLAEERQLRRVIRRDRVPQDRHNADIQTFWEIASERQQKRRDLEKPQQHMDHISEKEYMSWIPQRFGARACARSRQKMGQVKRLPARESQTKSEVVQTAMNDWKISSFRQA